MNNFIFIDKEVNTENIKRELCYNNEYWSMVSTLDNTSGDKYTPGFLPLIMGVQEPDKTIKDSEYLKTTPAFNKFPELIKTLSLYGFKSIARCAFFKLEVGASVKTHIDDGRYYLNKDRFHLSIQGNYEYQCDSEIHIIKPGTLFWFDNKKLHRAKNIDTVERLTFVFDVLHDDSPIRCHNGSLIQ